MRCPLLALGALRKMPPPGKVPRVALVGAGGSGGAVLEGRSGDIRPTPALAKETERFVWGSPNTAAPRFLQGIWVGAIVTGTWGQ